MKLIAKLAVPASGEVLLAGYVDAGLLQSWMFSPALAARGDAIVPLVERRVALASPVFFGLGLASSTP